MTNDLLSTGLVAFLVLTVAAGVAIFSIGAALIVFGLLGIAWVLLMVREAPEPGKRP